MLLQQLFAFTTASYAKIQLECKDYSMPGTGGVQDAILFNNDEMQALAMKQKVNGVRRQTWGVVANPPLYDPGPYSFRASTGTK